ncbi:MAG TPA: hypothetical protein PKW79_06020 [Rhabdochlamydiaceae bacterium]|nr:hypothetical protein [Rhabdochlamydiaceae bacterium]
MFKKTAIFSTLVLSLIASGWLFKLLYISQPDRDRYEQIRTQGKAVAQVSQNKESQQHRSGVRKDLWLAQEDKSRLHHRISSKTSVLTLVPIDDKVDIIENLQNLQCWMQDKLYPDMQQVRFFEAEQGFYQYSIQKFTASSVALSLFRLPGSQLPSTIDPKRAFLRGIAQDVSFAIAGKATQFQAQQFKATLLTQQGEKQ